MSLASISKIDIIEYPLTHLISWITHDGGTQKRRQTQRAASRRRTGFCATRTGGCTDIGDIEARGCCGRDLVHVLPHEGRARECALPFHQARSRRCPDVAVPPAGTRARPASGPVDPVRPFRHVEPPPAESAEPYTTAVTRR